MTAYRKTATRLWRPIWTDGDGPVALVAFCKVPTVTLWPDHDHAERSRRFIDTYGCGGGCHRDHAIVDLAEVGVR